MVSLRLAVGSGTKTQHPQVEPQARDIRENASTCDFRSMQTDAVLTSKGKHPQKQSKRARDNFSHSIGSGPCKTHAQLIHAVFHHFCKGAQAIIISITFALAMFALAMFALAAFAFSPEQRHAHKPTECDFAPV